MRELPIYNIDINDDDCFMSTISLVTAPAIEVDFMAFDKHEENPLQLQFTDEEKHIISGPVCLAGVPIYRRDERGEYYIVFTAETIEHMMLKYSEMELFNAVNLQHNERNYTEGVKMIEFYIKNEARGISPVEFQSAPNGSLFASFKVLDDKLWRDIKDNKLNGFSLEIFANLNRVEMSSEKEESLDDEIEKLLR